MKAHQSGFNLISLMVGVSLSMISILAMLALYKNLIGVSVQSIQDSRQDGQIAAGLLTAQREMLNAGFRNGVAPILLSGASLNNGTLSGTSQAFSTATDTAPAIGNAIVWTYQPTATGNATCAGLLVQHGSLLRLQAATSCTLISQWNSTTWSTTSLIEANQPTTFFALSYNACWPFAKTETATLSRLQVVMNATTSTVDINSNDPQPAYLRSKSTACLPNLEKPSA